ncbi:DUF3060 domain-containing protein [Bermanella marisrubri]|uniref:DNA topoisomerase IV subunit A n=1 Tax=Bermanella marisrubri TaxID=207949 RepID=Q1N2M2_9GAMM|nr:DUF3060 domain-containing protein [Bermanella marisrubri]EAT12385.1 DNA topoisomerase IV subunit A [Oceanobacter sp. RED65] [Bermanella marisrubri]QIZ85467.1 DUF3060 domain-containing protein [Bermanella marisrubri]
MKFWILVFFIFNLAACQLGIEDENEGEAEDIVRSYDNEIDDFDNDDETYNFTLTGTGNILDMYDDIEEMVISGDSNTITIVEDTELTELTITGTGNTVKLEPGITTRIITINISNENNTVSVSEYVNANYNSQNGNTVNGNQVSAQ